MKPIILLTILIIQSSHALENEDYYNRQFCTQESGQAEYSLPDRSRVDCLTDTHAFEADWADGLKVYESIGQSLYYAAETGKNNAKTYSVIKTAKKLDFSNLKCDLPLEEEVA